MTFKVTGLCLLPRRHSGEGPPAWMQVVVEATHRRNSRVRARVAHVFSIIKCQFGYRKARYKGLVKNRAQVLSLVALANEEDIRF